MATPSKPAPAASAPTESVAMRNAVVGIAVIAAGAALYWLRGILTPLALAIFLLVMIDGFVRLLKKRAPMLPQWAPLTIALVVWVGFFILTAFLVADNATSFVGQVQDYTPKLNSLIERVSTAIGIETPPSIRHLVAQLNLADRAGPFLQGLQNFASNVAFVLIYLGFLIASRAGFQKKIVRLFPHKAQRADALDAFQRIRNGVEQYLWIQTVTGLIIAAASWGVMEMVGLNNAFFWAFLIFVAGYIPVIGGAVGVLVPPVFALFQFPDAYSPAIILFVALNVINFIVANVILPRMQGQSLNLDPVVVLLALAFWGAIWGVAGMFLSTPLTVMAMVILAQFKGTEWIAILLSGDGDPLGEARSDAKKSPGLA
jgi:predicted PurR-regulated permease PerM